MAPTPRRIRRPLRSLLTVVVAAPLALATFSATSPAHAADKTPFIVIGTSDLSDSNLISKVIEPDFEAANPTLDFQYVPKGTGDAITLAETGAAAAILVHAASLENQFVAQGYSAEPYGRAFTYGDFVLAGRSTDAAGVAPAGGLSHDMVDAYQKIATAGAAGKAEFVSRGGTPGTTVAEHQIWALTTGVTLCNVSAANGGGKSPSTTTGDCPSTIPYPSWYHATGQAQGMNVQTADACNGFTSTECYVFTDRGTFQNLLSTTPPSIANLKILVRDNAASAPGGKDLLINNFHAYAVNPAKFPSDPGKTDLPDAMKLLDFLVSPTEQAKIAGYLASGGDAPFHASAAPLLTVVPPATQVTSGKAAVISGVLSNPVPGTLPLDGVPVNLLMVPKATPTATPTKVATMNTSATGAFQFSYVPKASETFTVAVDQITKIERPDLSPVFGDTLRATSNAAGATDVLSVINAAKVTKSKSSLHVTGNLSPSVIGTNGKVVLFCATAGSTTFNQVGAQPLTKGSAGYIKNFSIAKLTPGKYTCQTRYYNDGYQLPGSSAGFPVTVTTT